MNNYEEIYSLIDSINEKVKTIDKELIKVEEIKPLFTQLGTFTETLESAYKESDEAFSKSIDRIHALNKIITDELLNEYEDIFKNLKTKCTDIIDDLLDSVDVLKKPANNIVEEQLPPIVNRDDIIIKRGELEQPISKIEKPKDVIPVPKPVQPEIEILEM